MEPGLHAKMAKTFPSATRALDRLTRKGKRPYFLSFRSSTSLIIFTCSMAVFTDVFPYSVVVPVLPFALPERAGVAKDDLQRWTSLSLAIFGASVLFFSPFWGYFADRCSSRRGPMVFGLFLLAGATLMLTFMKNIAMLVIGRILQGATAGLTWAVCLALVVDTVDPEKVGQAMGFIGIATSFSTLTAPLLAGVTYAKGGWYEVWSLCYALIACDIVLRIIVIEKKHAVKWQREDGRGPLPSTRGAKNPPLTQTTSDEDTQAVQSKHVSLKSILGLFKNVRLLAALWGCAIETAIQTAFDAVLPLQVESLFGWDAIGAGLIFLPFVLPTLLGPLVGYVGDRRGPKWLVTFGFFLSTPFLVCLRFVQEDSMKDKVLLCVLLVGVGCGVTCTMGPLMAEISWAVMADRESTSTDERPPTALAYALYNVAYSSGTIIGPLLGGFVRDSAGWATVGWSMAILSGFTGVTQMLWIGGPLRLPRRKRGAEGEGEAKREAEAESGSDAESGSEPDAQSREVWVGGEDVEKTAGSSAGKAQGGPAATSPFRI